MPAGQAGSGGGRTRTRGRSGAAERRRPLRERGGVRERGGPSGAGGRARACETRSPRPRAASARSATRPRPGPRQRRTPAVRTCGARGRARPSARRRRCRRRSARGRAARWRRRMRARPGGEPRPEPRCSALIAVPDRGEQPLAGAGCSPDADDPRKQRGERKGDDGLQPDEQKRVVVGAGRRQRRDVERAIDPRRGAAPDDLGDQHQQNKCRSAPAAKHRTQKSTPGWASCEARCLRGSRSSGAWAASSPSRPARSGSRGARAPRCGSRTNCHGCRPS